VETGVYGLESAQAVCLWVDAATGMKGKGRSFFPLRIAVIPRKITPNPIILDERRQMSATPFASEP
jgi:hypothetical protein